jgi:16S rRNA (guanine527-N7)-methyltransferase
MNRYIDILLKWNKIHSLTSYNKEELFEQISYTIEPIQYLPPIQEAIDIGSGAGIPGLILAMHMPNTHWNLIEPIQKRYSFLNYAKLKLNLKNVTIIPKRVEQITPFKVDLITSRALKDTKSLIELSKEFINKDTIMLLYKGSQGVEQLDKIKAKKQIYQTEKLNYIILKEIHV